MLNDPTINIFSSRDKIRSQIIDLASNYLQLENFDFNQTSYLSYLVDTISILTSNLMFYNSSVYREQFLTKAMQRESVLNLSNMIGYKATLAKPSTCSVLLSIPITRFTSGSNASKHVSIHLIGRSNIPTDDAGELTSNQVFKVYASNVIFSLKDSVQITYINGVWSVYQQVIFDDGNGNLNPNGWKNIETRISNGFLEFYLNFVQLEDVTDTFTIPLLQPYEFHNLKFLFKKTGYLSDIGVFFVSTATNQVLEEWVRKESIFLLSPNEAAYAYRELESGVMLSFGNGIIGKQPSNNSTCVVTAGITQGYAGNVISGSIRKADPVFYSYDSTTGANGFQNGSELSIKVINKEPAIGGEDPPSIDEIKSEAIKSVSTNQRLVSGTDFKNADLVVEDLPIKNVFQVLKRSDLKRNEIVLFTDLVYNDIIVPTKNLYIENIPFTESDDEITYKAGTVLNEYPDDVSSDEYLTLFDVIVNKHTKESTYYYYLDELDVPVTLVQTSSKEPSDRYTKILPIFTHISTDRTGVDEYLNIELHTNALDLSNEYLCKLNIELSSKDYPSEILLNKVVPTNVSSDASNIIVYTTKIVLDSSGNQIGDSSSKSIPLEFVSDGTCTLKFELYYDSSGTNYGNTSKVDVIIKRNLSEFMFSQVLETSSDGRDGPHSADTDKDYKISGDELNRVIDLYNAGRYHTDSTTIDGFAPGVGSEEGDYHDLDVDKDWVISVSELGRAIQFFNSGGYHTDSTTEDGFAPGPPESVYDRTFSVYDIPCIKRKFYEGLTSDDKVLFTKQVLQKIISFDVYAYKMLTDFVNLKFANTSGKSRNMKFLDKAKKSVRDINPKTMPVDISPGYRYAVSEDKNVWKDFYDDNYDSEEISNISSYNREGGFIAEYFENKVINDSSQASGWLFEALNTNDVFVATHLYGDNTSKTFIFNGSDFEEPIFDIPFKIKILVFTDPKITTTDTTLRQKISNALIDNLAVKFGYNSSIYISEISKIVQNCPGVRNCVVLEPKHDIFFNEDMDDLTQDELVRYTPELVYFGSDDITIDIKSTSSF